MKSKNKILAVTAFAMLSLMGCNIDPILTDSYSEDVAWSNVDNLRLNLNGFYSLIGGYYGSEVENDACTDILKMNGPRDSENLFVFGSAPITPAANPFNNWDNRHTWQLSCCRFLHNLAEHRGNFPESIANEAEAEARFFRALVNFDLAKRFGASFILHKELPVMGEKNHARCTPEECWDFIYEDLTFAAKYLPKRWDDATKDPWGEATHTGRVTQGAAWGMLARAMLYAQRWKDASDAALEVKKLGYALYKNPSRPDKGYGELFMNRRSARVDNNESIIECGYSYDDEMDYSFDYFYCPPSDGGYAEASPTEDLVSAYEMADGREFSWSDPTMKANPYVGREPRFYAWVCYDGGEYSSFIADGSPLILEARNSQKHGYNPDRYNRDNNATGYFSKKRIQPNFQWRSQDNGNNYAHTPLAVIRLAELYLNLAECHAALNSKQDVLDNLNIVRNRAGIPDLELSDINSDMSLMDWVRSERYAELWFEGHRYFDARRWTIAPEVFKAGVREGLNAIAKKDPSFREFNQRVKVDQPFMWNNKMYLLPINDSEIYSNPQLVQSPEY